jgi:hypothetical protein
VDRYKTPMALHKKAEFARICHLTTGNLTKYITRKKVTERPDGMFDDADLVNAEFIKRRKEMQETKESGEKPTETPGKTPKMKRKPGKTPETPGTEPSAPGEMYALDVGRKKAQIESAEAERQLKMFQIQRMQGKLIPTDLVKIAFTTAFRAVNTGFKQTVDDLLTEIAAKYRLNVNEMAEEKGRAIRMINDSINRNADTFKSEIANIISEYSQNS